MPRRQGMFALLHSSWNKNYTNVENKPLNFGVVLRDRYFAKEECTPELPDFLVQHTKTGGKIQEP
jgi:hypothetical protein